MIIKILTYNIWFDDTYIFERLDSLIKVIKRNDPDIICCQEVVPEIYKRLKNNLGDEYKYNFPDRIKSNYGCVIFSKHKMTQYFDQYYPETDMKRGLIAINIEINNKFNLTIATSHFESIFCKKNTVKINQYIHAQNVLDKLYDNNNHNPIIFCSDTNLLDGEEKYFFKNKDWKDSYSDSDFENTYTYDTKRNTHLIKKNMKEIRGRIDRILYKDNNILKLNDYKLIIGQSDDIDIIEPSDHFGVMATFDIS
jgi:tyrosyl-DNA phosphodiesterase 2